MKMLLFFTGMNQDLLKFYKINQSAFSPLHSFLPSSPPPHKKTQTQTKIK